jgi:NAD(P)-dependent dehydrogenase (short-subunit alcohol dehydrogenase family)
MGKRFEGKVAVVTGGASGIGRRTAEALLEQGALVVIGDRDEASLAECGRMFDSARCSTARVDVTAEEDVRRLVDAAVERFGRLDIGINSAGIGALSSIRDHSVDAWRAVVDVCLTGVFLSLKHEVRQMDEQGEGGAIVNIASINARQPAEGMSAYCSAKAGVEMLTKVAALEVAQAGIRVNAISPGFVETPMTAPTRQAVRDRFIDSIPIGRPGSPDDIARAVLFLAGDEASWVSGETLVVDGGEVHREYPRLLTQF